MGSFAQFERDLIADRTKQGLEAKKQQGVRLGRPETITENCKQQAIELRKKGYKLSKIKEMTGVSMAQVSKWTSVLA
jgi:DNA invertase Pin-like site-specific DNA recombinase